VKFMNETGDLYDGQGVSPFAVYVVRERGKVETGEASCAECHSRVLADGSVIRGAQGNRPIEKIKLLGLAADVAAARDPEAALADARAGERTLFGAPWLRPDPQARLDRFSAAEIEAAHAAIPSGVFARQGTSPFSPAKLPDLIGIRERKYLDASGLVRHRSIGDLMRYAALNQGMDLLARFGDFISCGHGRLARAAPRQRLTGAVQRRTALCVGAIHLLARAAAQPEPPDAAHGARRRRVRARAMRQVPYAAAVHQQHGDARFRLHHPSGPPCQIRHPAR
jgi:hypothetical protein